MQLLQKIFGGLKDFFFAVAVIIILMETFGLSDIQTDCPRCWTIFEKMIGTAWASSPMQRPDEPPPFLRVRYVILPVE